MPTPTRLTARQRQAIERARQARAAQQAAAENQVQRTRQAPENENQEAANDWRARLAAARDRRQDAAARLENMISTLEEVCERSEEQGRSLAQVDADYGELLDVIDGLSREVQDASHEESRLAGASVVGAPAAPAPGPDRGGFSLGRATLGYLSGWESPGSGVDREILTACYREAGMSQGVITRALEWTVSGTGGLLIPAQLLGDWIERLSPNTVVGALGAVFSPYGGPVSIPKVLTGSTSFWVGEGKKATMGALATGAINLTPKPLVTVIPLSDSLLRYAPARLQADVNRDMQVSQSEALDYALLVGGGGEGMPLGIKNMAGGTTSFASIDILGADQNVTDLIEAIAAAPATRNVRGRVGGAMHPSTLLKLRKAKDANGQPLLKMAENAPTVDSWVDRGQIHNLPYATTTQLAYSATSDLIVAVWSELRVASFGVAELFASREAYEGTSGANAFLQRQTWLRLSTEWDSGLRHPEAVEVAGSFNAAAL